MSNSNRAKSARERASNFAKYLGKGHSIQKNDTDAYGVYMENYGLVATIKLTPSQDQMHTGHARLAHSPWCAANPEFA